MLIAVDPYDFVWGFYSMALVINIKCTGNVFTDM